MGDNGPFWVSCPSTARQLEASVLPGRDSPNATQQPEIPSVTTPLANPTLTVCAIGAQASLRSKVLKLWASCPLNCLVPLQLEFLGVAAARIELQLRSTLRVRRQGQRQSPQRRLAWDHKRYFTPDSRPAASPWYLRLGAPH